ncbi:leucyl aminopeptidase [Paenibacillus sp. J5C_2022]|uniref:leucyl aminopeptidase n=1 Tax=Paenibacillus sp. J5C2022 TaxID=2977129 RepID=UPI0021CEAD31|nr:leucyl aminopeptidase [Paenibacillus sp. J5C2022]MCU6711157.1 leucyl aminopeptidase [Paenibacillus sp. J5C2022]
MTIFTYGKEHRSGVSPDVFVRFIHAAELNGEAAIVGPEIDRSLRSSYKKKRFLAGHGQVEIVPTLGLHEAEHIAFVGYEPGQGARGIRLAGAAAAKAMKSVGAEHGEVYLDPASFGEDCSACGAEPAAQALVEGILLALHDRRPLLKEPNERFRLQTVALLADEASNMPGGKEAWERGMERGRTIAEAVCFARDLTNLPGNDLTPERLAFQAEELARELELDIEVIDEWTAEEQGMGGLLGVGHGSVNPPRMIVIHYNGASDSDEVWGLIGKGITFDTGGISLKKAPGMEEMISDMGGAAAVLGAMRAIAELKAPVNVLAVIPAAENMPSDRAYKPGDVLRMMNGTTVEIVNTDAEGRLVLADGLTTAIRRGATKLVDVATLTGAVMVALGYEATGAIGNNDELMGEVLAASERSGERVWQLPAYDEYRKLLRSDAADMKNGGGRYAGTITGGLFIGHFAEGLPWVHLDIGGTAWLERDRGWEPKGGTGAMARTLVELVTHTT